jgi:hypothetical protein
MHPWTLRRNQTAAVLLDPKAISRAEFVEAQDTLKEEQRKSPKAWTESAIEEFKKRLSDFQVREQGVEETKLGVQSPHASGRLYR